MSNFVTEDVDFRTTDQDLRYECKTCDKLIIHNVCGICKANSFDLNISEEKNEMNEDLNRKKWWISKKAGETLI